MPGQFASSLLLQALILTLCTITMTNKYTQREFTGSQSEVLLLSAAGIKRIDFERNIPFSFSVFEAQKIQAVKSPSITNNMKLTILSPQMRTSPNHQE